MGFFSKCCAKSHLPIVVAAREVPPLNQVVALTPDGAVVEGSYDGYGRVSGVELMEDEQGNWQWPKIKMVLKQHYKGESYKDLPKSHDELAQGYFMSNEFLDYCMKVGSFKSRKGYEKAFKELADW